MVLQQFTRYQVADGDSVDVLSFDDPVSSWAKSFNYPLIALGPCATFYGFTERLVPWLRKNAASYDVVLVHGIWQFHSLATWFALAGTSLPYVVYTHGMLDPGHHRVNRLKQVQKQLYWWLAEYRVLRDAAAVFFTTEEERRIAPQGVWPVRWRRSDLAPPGVAQPPSEAEAQREAFFGRFPKLRDQRLLLFLGRFDPKKGAPLLIEAFSRLIGAAPDVLLVMVGPDNTEQARSLREQVPARLRDRVVWTGMLLGDEKWGAFRASEAFIIPSHTENYCIAAVEALACGVPVLMSDKVNIHPIVSAHRAGYVEPDDASGCLNLLTRWLDTPREEWSAMRERARGCFEVEFGLADAYRQFRKALAAVARARPTASASAGASLRADPSDSSVS